VGKTVFIDVLEHWTSSG